jgi:hypothetical protein
VKPESLQRRAACALAGASLLVAGTVAAYSTYGLGQLECQTHLDKRGEDQEQQALQRTRQPSKR